jgi:hypothetical protein
VVSSFFIGDLLTRISSVLAPARAAPSLHPRL